MTTTKRQEPPTPGESDADGEPTPGENDADGEPKPGQSDADGDADDAGAVAERVRERSEAIAEREVERALRRLEARGDLTGGQRRAVRAMADGIVESLVAAPARTVTAAAEADEDALATVVDLFDPEE